MPDIIISETESMALKIKEKFPDTVLMFVTAPDATILKNRLVGRGTEEQDVIDARLSRAYEESLGVENYDYLVINDDLDACVKELHELLTKSHEEIQTQYHPNNYSELIEDIRTQLKGLVKGEK